MMKKDPLGYGNKDSAGQRTERTRTAQELRRQGLAGRMSDGPETPYTPTKMPPRTLGERATIKKERLAMGNPRKGGGMVGKTSRGNPFK